MLKSSLLGIIVTVRDVLTDHILYRGSLSNFIHTCEMCPFCQTNEAPDANVIINHVYFVSCWRDASENWAVLLWECFPFNSSRINKSVSKLILSWSRLQKKAVGVLWIFVHRFLCLWAEPTVKGFHQQREQQAPFETRCWGIGINTVTLFFLIRQHIVSVALFHREWSRSRRAHWSAKFRVCDVIVVRRQDWQTSQCYTPC